MPTCVVIFYWLAIINQALLFDSCLYTYLYFLLYLFIFSFGMPNQFFISNSHHLSNWLCDEWWIGMFIYSFIFCIRLGMFNWIIKERIYFLYCIYFVYQNLGDGIIIFIKNWTSLFFPYKSKEIIVIFCNRNSSFWIPSFKVPPIPYVPLRIFGVMITL